MDLIKGAEQKGARARENRWSTQGQVVWVSPASAMLNICRVDVGAKLADGTPVYLEDVPFSPQMPPTVGNFVPLEYHASSPHSVRVGIGKVSGQSGQSGLTINAGNVVNSIKKTGESSGQVGDIELEPGAGISITRGGKKFTIASTIADPMVFKGVIDCSANPNYPAADAGDVYKISVAGKIGGASGVNVEAGDTIYCITDSTASGTQAAVGANWVIVQVNIDGAVTGPSSATGDNFASFNGTSGKIIKDSGKATPSGAVVGTSDTQTLTNKRVTKRTGTVASSATPTINTDNVDFYSITALAAAITSFTSNLSGTPTQGQTLWIAITDDGTARAISWGSSFEASTIPLPTTTVVSTRLDVGFVWNTVTSKWRCVAVA